MRIPLRETAHGHANNAGLLKNARLHNLQARVVGAGRLGAIAADYENAVNSCLTSQARRKLLKLGHGLDMPCAHMWDWDQASALQPGRRTHGIHRICARDPGKENFGARLQTLERRVHHLGLVGIHLDRIIPQHLGNAERSGCVGHAALSLQCTERRFAF